MTYGTKSFGGVAAGSSPAGAAHRIPPGHRHGRPSDRTVGRTLGTAAQDGTQGRGRRPVRTQATGRDPGNSDAANPLLTRY